MEEKENRNEVRSNNGCSESQLHTLTAPVEQNISPSRLFLLQTFFYDLGKTVILTAQPEQYRTGLTGRRQIRRMKDMNK
jgi:hypothetical protein